MSQSAVKYMEVRWRVKGTLQWSAPKQYPPAAEVAVDGLERDTDYEFEARNVSDCGASSEWVPSDYTVPTPPELPAVTSLVATPVSYAMHFTWSIDVAPSASILYSFERAAAAAGPFTQLAILRSNAYTAPETTGTTYWYRVCAMNVAGEKGTYSNIVSGGALVGKVQTFYQDTAPSGTGRTEGDLWFDTDDGNHPYRWSGSAWVSVQDGDISAAATSASSAIAAANNAMTAAQAAQATADGAIRTYYQSSEPTGLNSTTDLGDLWFDTDTNQAHRWNGSSWILIEDNTIAQALAAAQSAQTTADGKITAYYQASEPTSGIGAGDLWYDTNDNNKPYYYTGSAWKTIRDGTIGQVFRQASPPTPTSNNDMWFDSDDNNCPYVASGSSWINVRDGTILQAANNANDARSIANNAKTAAENAQSTADGKVSPGDSIVVLGDRTLVHIADAGGRYAASESGADNTANHTAGQGSNLLPYMYTTFKSGTPLPPLNHSGNGTSAYISSAFGISSSGGWLAFTPNTDYVSDAQRFDTSPAQYPLFLAPGYKYIISFRSCSNGSGETRADFGIMYSDASYAFTPEIATDADSSSPARKSVVLDLTNGKALPCHFFIRSNKAGWADGAAHTTYFDAIMIERMIGNDPTPSSWVPGYSLLGRPGSGDTIGDQRNLLPVTFAGISSMPTSQPIAFSISGTTISFTVAAFTLNAGGITVSYSASSATRGDQSAGTTRTYYLFYQDPGLAGGSKTLNVTVYLSTLAASPYNVFIGSCVVTIAAGGGGSSGGGGGGGGVLLPPGSGDYPIP